ncbi:MAG: hypothetical protein ACYDBQ_04545 [Thermoplasmatota archaeon]
MRLILLAALVVALMPAALGQQDACTQSSPCLWSVEVDGAGFVGESSWNWTAGDWVDLSTYNGDSVAHTLQLSGYGVSQGVPAATSADKVLQLTQAGSFTLTDSPSGATGTLVVAAPMTSTTPAATTSSTAPPTTSPAGAPSTSSSALSSSQPPTSTPAAHTPGPGLVLALGALAVACAARRR